MRPIPPLLLAALVAWPSIGYSEPSPQQSGMPPGWQRSQRPDAADGSAVTRFTLVGKSLASPQASGSDRPDLVVDCAATDGSSSHKGRMLAATLHAGAELKVLYIEPEEIHGMGYVPTIDVLFHTDAVKQEKEQWSPGGDKKSLSVPRDTLKKILHAHTADVAATDVHGAPVNLQFDLADSSQVEQACGW